MVAKINHSIPPKPPFKTLIVVSALVMGILVTGLVFHFGSFLFLTVTRLFLVVWIVYLGLGPPFA